MFGPYSESVADREAAMERLRVLVAGGEQPASAVKRLREEEGLTQRGLARRSGVSQATISKIEAGEQMLTGEAARKLGVALKVNAADLALWETFAGLGQLALQGKFDPEAAVEAAVRLVESEPDVGAGQRLADALVEALADIAQTAAKNQEGAAVATESKKPEDLGRRTTMGRRRHKPFGVPEGR